LTRQAILGNRYEKAADRHVYLLCHELEELMTPRPRDVE